MRVLGKPAIAHFYETEYPLENVKDMLDPGAHRRFCAADLALAAGQVLASRRVRLRQIRRAPRFLANDRCLTRDKPSRSTRAFRRHAATAATPGCRERSPGSRRTVDDSGLAIHSDVRLHPEVPFVALLGLLHLRVTFTRAVLGRAGVSMMVVNDRSGANLHLATGQKLIDLAQDCRLQVLLFEQVTELADRRLVGYCSVAQVNGGEPPHRNHIVESLFDGGIAQVEPLLKKVNAQHAVKRDRRSPTFARRIVQIDQRAQPLPRHDCINKERRPFGLTRIALKSGADKRHLLFTLQGNKYSRKALAKSDPEYP